MNLTALQVQNVNALVVLLSTQVTDEQYDHMYINGDTRRCAAGHAADHRALFQREVVNEVEPSFFGRLFGQKSKVITTTEPFQQRPYGESNFAAEAFGETTWEAVFARYAFRGVDPNDVTREMVIERLKRIAADGRYIPVEEVA